MTEEIILPKLVFGATYRCGDEGRIKSLGDYDSFLRCFLATELYVTGLDRTYTSQADSFYYLYQLLEIIPRVASAELTEVSVSSGEQLEFLLSPADGRYSYQILDSGACIHKESLSKIQALIFLCRHCAGLIESIESSNIDVNYYIEHFPPQ